MEPVKLSECFILKTKKKKRSLFEGSQRREKCFSPRGILSLSKIFAEYQQAVKEIRSRDESPQKTWTNKLSCL